MPIAINDPAHAASAAAPSARCSQGQSLQLKNLWTVESIPEIGQVFESAFIIKLFWRDWVVEERGQGWFLVCLHFSLILDLPKTDLFWQAVAWQWCISHAVWVWKKRGGAEWEKRKKKQSDTKVLTGNSAILDKSNCWRVEPFHLVWTSWITAKVFFLPFSAIHITPTITALRSCIFCLCKPRRQCVYWPFCCFWNVSQKIVLSKVSSFFSSTGDQNGRKCTWFLKNFSYTSPQVAFPIKEGLGEQVNGKL